MKMTKKKFTYLRLSDKNLEIFNNLKSEYGFYHDITFLVFLLKSLIKYTKLKRNYEILKIQNKLLKENI